MSGYHRLATGSGDTIRRSRLRPPCLHPPGTPRSRRPIALPGTPDPPTSSVSRGSGGSLGVTHHGGKGPDDVELDALVVGGGPSGSVTALLLARAGWQVELVDRTDFPRGKACGECLNPAGVAILRELDLLEPVLATHPAPLEGWEISPLSEGRARGRFSGPDRALGIQRRTFDHALLEAARTAGVRVRTGTTLVEADPGGRGEPARVLLRGPAGQQERRRSRILIGADGLRSRVARAIGLALPPRGPTRASLTWRVAARGPSRRRGRLLLGRGCTVGFAPVGDPQGTLWNLTLVLTGSDRTGELKGSGWARAIESLGDGGIVWSEPPEIVDGPWGSGSFHRPVRGVVRGRTLLVGDAAGYFDPLTGQGIFRALRSACLAADSLTHGDSHRLPDHVDSADRSIRLHPGDMSRLEQYASTLDHGLRWSRRLQKTIDWTLALEPARRVSLSALRTLPGVASALIRLTGDRPRTLLTVPSPTLPLTNPRKRTSPADAAAHGDSGHLS
ncbi:MAG: hypothetical protein EA422_13820 [Gemmatimonadales bacterium]|nr:MAG: hypothetical protein EA422_13820 [Gemmatimonadales bacterium]